MIPINTQKQIISIWDNYIKTNKNVFDTKGNLINDIDAKRIIAIEDIKGIVSSFQSNIDNIFEFKTKLDSYNKRNNLWGFTATKGQMFFNQLTKYNVLSQDELTTLLKNCISEPKDLKDALKKIDALEKFTSDIFNKANDKRKAPNPGSVGYFLSYFWQIHNYYKWPIIYTSLTNAFKENNIWVEHKTQREDYEYFFNLNEEIKGILSSHTKTTITNWDAEHCFWNFSSKPVTAPKKSKEDKSLPITIEVKEAISIKASFEIFDYIIPAVAKLLEAGSETTKSASAKGYAFEKMVSDVFSKLGFEVEYFGQGTGRNPDAIVKHREDHIAFIVDAKAYNEGYVMGRDDRAIKEYIATFCPQLRKDGFTKIGFIIVSNSFKTDLKDFASEITWNTDIKRFIQLTSDALLHYLAYKTKDDKITLSTIIDHIVNSGNIIKSQNIIAEFDDF